MIFSKNTLNVVAFYFISLLKIECGASDSKRFGLKSIENELFFINLTLIIITTSSMEVCLLNELNFFFQLTISDCFESTKVTITSVTNAGDVQSLEIQRRGPWSHAYAHHKSMTTIIVFYHIVIVENNRQIAVV